MESLALQVTTFPTRESREGASQPTQARIRKGNMTDEILVAAILDILPEELEQYINRKPRRRNRSPVG